MRTVLVLGASGYVGARLVPRLARKGCAVRAAGRSLAKLQARPWADDPRVRLVRADATDPASLRPAMEGCEVVYHLVHAMGGRRRGFAQRDLQAARAVAETARSTGVRRIVYLGGLGEGADLSEHLRSRHEVGDALRAGGVPVTEFRAAVILGAGSAAFEILRYLADRLPVMVAPRWVSTPVQPIAVRDALGYLVDCLDAPETENGTFGIGGPEVLTYRALMDLYAEEAGLRRRLVLGVPVLTPRLSSYWIHLVTPAPAALARPLAEGLRNPVVVRDARIRDVLPRDLTGCREAIRLALDPRQRRPGVRWNGDPLPPSAWRMPGDAPWTGGTVLEAAHAVTVPAAPPEAWASLVRARPGPWRVEQVGPGARLRLAGRTRLPGEEEVEVRVRPAEGGGSRVEETERFRPHGLAGILSWHAARPLRALARRRALRAFLA